MEKRWAACPSTAYPHGLPKANLHSLDRAKRPPSGPFSFLRRRHLGSFLYLYLDLDLDLDLDVGYRRLHLAVVGLGYDGAAFLAAPGLKVDLYLHAVHQLHDHYQ